MNLILINEHFRFDMASRRGPGQRGTAVIAETPFFKNEKRKEKFCFQSQASRVEMRNFILSLKP